MRAFISRGLRRNVAVAAKHLSRVQDALQLALEPFHRAGAMTAPVRVSLRCAVGHSSSVPVRRLAIFGLRSPAGLVLVPLQVALPDVDVPRKEMESLYSQYEDVSCQVSPCAHSPSLHPVASVWS